MRRFDGRKDLGRRMRAEDGNTEDFDEAPRAFRKTSLTFALRVDEPFEVDTLEGLHTGKSGDYLAIGAHGELYAIDADVFASTYEPVEG